MDLRFRLGIDNDEILAALKVMEVNLETPLNREHVSKHVGISLRQLERKRVALTA